MVQYFVLKVRNLPVKLDYFLVLLIGLTFSAAMSPSRTESLALTSGDDGPIYPSTVLKNKDLYKNFDILNLENSLVLMWSTLTKWLPALAYKFLDINPGIFHTTFVYLQITLILLGVFRISQSMFCSRTISYISVALTIIYESYFINMGAYGGQTWMPYTTWLAVGPLLFSWGNYLDGKKHKGLLLLVLGTLIHPGMGLSAAILIIFTQIMYANKFLYAHKIKNSLLIIGVVATVSQIVTLPIRIAQLKPVPNQWNDLEVSHWLAWNLSNGQSYFQQSKYTVVFTLSILAISNLYKKELRDSYQQLTRVIIVTLISVTTQGVVSTINFRDIASMNLSRVTIFSSIFLTVVASKLLMSALQSLHSSGSTVTTMLVVFSLIFPSNASFFLTNLSISYSLYKNKKNIKEVTFLVLICLITGVLYLVNLFDISKDTGSTFIQDYNFYMSSTLSTRALQSYFQGWTVIVFLLLFICFMQLHRVRLLKQMSIIILCLLMTVTIYGRLELSQERLKENFDWISTQVWAKENTNVNDVFITSGKSNVYGAWSTLTNRIIINADAYDSGNLYLYSEADRNYQLLRKEISVVPVPFSDIENFQEYVINLSFIFNSNYLISSNLDVKYSFPVVYSNSKYTVYIVKK
jgi:hypothetical protein